MYRHTENWVPFVDQNVRFRRENNNVHDRFGVAGQVTMQGKIGHIPRELSHYIWHAMYHGAQFTARVADDRYKRSPLDKEGWKVGVTNLRLKYSVKR